MMYSREICIRYTSTGSYCIQAHIVFHLFKTLVWVGLKNTRVSFSVSCFWYHEFTQEVGRLVLTWSNHNCIKGLIGQCL